MGSQNWKTNDIRYMHANERWRLYEFLPRFFVLKMLWFALEVLIPWVAKCQISATMVTVVQILQLELITAKIIGQPRNARKEKIRESAMLRKSRRIVKKLANSVALPEADLMICSILMKKISID